MQRSSISSISNSTEAVSSQSEIIFRWLLAVVLITLFLVCVILGVVITSKCNRDTSSSTHDRSLGASKYEENVWVDSERELIVNLLAPEEAGESTVFGTRRMGVAKTFGANRSSDMATLVSWTPQHSAGFSVKVQVVARVTGTQNAAIDDVVCWTLFFLGSRTAEGVTTLMQGPYDELEQHTGSIPLPIPTPEVAVVDNIVTVSVKGCSTYNINWGGDIEVLESTSVS
jgi:hypothetical protein